MCNEWLKQGGPRCFIIALRSEHPLKLEAAPANIGTPT